MTTNFTFRSEVMEKYDHEVYDAILDAFNSLPISALADDKYICMHGGISPEIKKTSDIDKVDRFVEPPL
jgi:serine/threonine-protein phosphatase 2B catalytic subunit